MQTVNVGLVGFGLAGRVLHAPFIHAVSGLHLAGVVTSRAAEVAVEYPQASVYSRIEDILAQKDIDLIVVATPHRYHIDHSRLALEAGKHVVVEKPITDSLSAMQGLIETAQQVQRLLIPYHQRRYDSDFRTVKQIIDSGVLGKIHYFESNWPMYRPQPRGVWREQADEQGGIFYDLGPHLIDHALQLFGDPRTVYAQIQCNRPGMQVDDLFRLHLHYDSGLDVLLSTDNLAPHPVPRFLVRGLKGSFVKYGLDPQEACLRAGQRPFNTPVSWGEEPPDSWGTLYQDFGSGVTTSGPVKSLPGDHRLYWQAVYAAIAQNAAPPVQPHDVLPQIKIINAAHVSARTNTLQRIE